MFDYLIVGGGIIGLSVADALQTRRPGARIAVIEKESELGTHQSGHNSGVIHSGIYYTPGSRKAELTREGRADLVAFCREQGIPLRIPGKLIAASGPEDIERLRALQGRGVANGVDCRWLSGEQAMEIEPHLRCDAALFVPAAGVVEFREVCRKLGERLTMRGGTIRTGSPVRSIDSRSSSLVVITGSAEIEARQLINCAGLHSDRVARMAGVEPPVRIVPFRGEYWSIREERSFLVKELVYPVPDPRFPFLGIHLTRGIDQRVHAGPNAVVAWKREGYDKRSFLLRDTVETLLFRGFWKMAGRHAGRGLAELLRSSSRQLFARSLRRLIPELTEDDLESFSSGVRAQAVARDGTLVDDFLVVENERTFHLLNVPSPAATASPAIARWVAAHFES
ncbi:MAG TPA: L-2-hydroxyglutarate oxidase [Thermoanaerobaculia bacterium]|nr:L-2-hydroxyglutarate oxidase [Thermoanaerobaculia bacterium]